MIVRRKVMVAITMMMMEENERMMGRVRVVKYRDKDLDKDSSLDIHNAMIRSCCGY